MGRSPEPLTDIEIEDVDDAANAADSPRDTILEAALETMADMQISGTRMREIARRSGISQGHLHYYFAKKSDLFLAIADRMSAAFLEGRRSALDDTALAPQRKLEVFFEQEARLIESSLNLLKVRLDLLLHGTSDPVIELKLREMYSIWGKDISNVVRQGVEAGVFAEDHAAVVPNLLIALMEGAVLQHLNDPEGFDVRMFFDAAGEMILKLLMPESPAAS